MRPGAFAAKSAKHLDPFRELGLLVTSAALFFLAFPNPLNTWGFGFLGFAALAPLFLLYNLASWPRLLVIGPLSGFSIYLLFNHWLGAYHPLAIFIVPLITAAEFLPLACGMRLARRLAPRSGWMLQLAVWVAFEYLRTQGFLGYPYGLIGYSQFQFLPLARLSSVTGVWGVSALVAFPSIWCAWVAADHWSAADAPPGVAGRRWGAGLVGLGRELLRRPLPGAAWVAVFAGAVAWGTFQAEDCSADPTRRMVLVQQNVDPWIGGVRAYGSSLDALIRQTEAALAATPDVDLVVWSETCFIPAIEWHDKYREDPDRYALVRRLKDYLAGLEVPVVLGNGEAEAWSDGSGSRLRRDYNAVLVYEGRRQTGGYRKVRLIPFTESFPYKEQLPWLHRLLLENDTSLWEAGRERVVLEAAGVRFGTPICFEDSFGDIARDFFDRGAELIVNLSNDSWSRSEAGAMQHLAMAAFRAMENRRTVVRSTNGGMSALILPDGTIPVMNKAFTESWIAVDAPVHVTPPTPYRRWGDWLGILAVSGAIAGFAVAGSVSGLRVIRARGRKTD
jgi:apolipoprotein N-acyltransferase